MKASALIAEDEPLLAQSLQAELTTLWPELEVVAVAGNGLQAQQALLAQAPDVAFLDVRMPGASGIEVAQAIAEDWPEGTQPPLLVFVTAYEQFAVEAFSQAAVDYLLKPVARLRLHQTVQRLKQRLAERASGSAEFTAGSEIDRLAGRLRQLLAEQTPSGPATASRPPPGGDRHDAGGAAAVQPEPLRVITAGVGDTVRLIRLADVLYLQATDKYVNVVTAEAEALIREPLRDLLPRLDAQQFVQIHRSTVVNLDHVRSASRDEAGKLWLALEARKERLAVSRLHAHRFKAM
jgi:DNA-binding LytR/AlgR family response regulator